MRKYVLKNNIAFYRRKAGLSQSELASIINVSKNSISSFERGDFSPSAFTAILLCNALNVSFSDLFYMV